MRILTIFLVTVLALGACSEKSKRVYFGGNYYPTKEKGGGKDDRALFATTVRRADQGVDGAREAGRHGGAKYCIKNFGTSEIEWINGPDAPLQSLQSSNGNLVLTGRCVTW
ncbi:hypothetical protein [Roseovarius sp. 2305UL8-3]|uniref:hypothetical protein n=1 Tax=Roseovarius conchicola TaxID=3121636 RepID=UPI003527ED0B